MNSNIYRQKPLVDFEPTKFNWSKVFDLIKIIAVTQVMPLGLVGIAICIEYLFVGKIDGDFGYYLYSVLGATTVFCLYKTGSSK